MQTAQLFIDGSWVDGGSTAVVEDKFTGEHVAEVAQASADQVGDAIGALHAAHQRGVMPPYDRSRILTRASRLIEERAEELRDLIVQESGFTRSDAAGEVARATQTLRLSGEEATRLTGEMVPLDGAPNVRDRIGFTIRRPVGVVCAITPFNSPLNTVAHKVGPALAAGNTVALKPATPTPLTAGALVRILLDAGLPPDQIALLNGSGRAVGQPLLEDERIAFYTFTGSTEVGRHISATVGLRRTQLELGSLASTIVCPDADIDDALHKSTSAAFRKAGQVCTSVQRLYVHREVHEQFTERLIERVEALKAGDPNDDGTFVGPLISLAEAERVENWVGAAVDGGAECLTGGVRDQRVVRPTVLSGVHPSMQVMCEEVFGPVVSVRAFDDFEATLHEVNDTPYGLATGVFTKDIRTAMIAAERLHVGSVHINQTSSSRIDLMPYGGVKDSGFGHEGPKYAAREMTEERLITIDYA